MKLNKMAFKKFNNIEELEQYLTFWGEINRETVVLIHNENTNVIVISKKVNKNEIYYEVEKLHGYIRATNLKDLIAYIKTHFDDCSCNEKIKELKHINTISLNLFSDKNDLRNYIQKQKNISFEDIVILKNNNIQNYSILRLHVEMTKLSDSISGIYGFYDVSEFGEFYSAETLEEFIDLISENYMN